MDDAFKDPVQFSKGINLRELMNSGTEFHIDMDFKKPGASEISTDDDLFAVDDDDDDSDSEDVLKILEDKTDNLMLSSPEYHSFEELAKKMVDCEPSGNVKVLILEEGGGPLVPLDAEVTIHYAAYWERASIPFDSTLTMNCGSPKHIRLGQSAVIPGLEIGLTTVKGPSARFLLLIQPKAAWGPLGVPPRIRPEPALFVVALYAVRDAYAGARFNDLPSEEQRKFEVTTRTVNSLHGHSKELFKKKRYNKAIRNYQQSVSVLNLSRPQNKDEEKEVKRLKINAFLNLAVCFTKIEKPKHVIRMLECLDYITDTEKHCKALFYYGKAYEMLGKTELAIQYYQKALKLEPKNIDIGKALNNLDGYLKSSEVKVKELWQNAFKVDAEAKEKVNVDEDFQNGVKELLEDLAGSNEYARFDLPPGLNGNEVDYVKNLAEEFSGLTVFEEGEGKKKKVTIVKKLV
ncbi:inactive peptidyl-prolyl cis-trans isomerase shutdown-like [Pectinophora gossypiella]|uniref:inactive peptidyl-prolyl cis-trans isomerase shutdown-like n=1 Tax=Pectinophora gossypiella TaxID=13191 RepID=UPI00214F1E04|nr:inactive peptidyl-prolyl cis-trans isomerase shutdown-like [Pectinophora gossypiella]